MINNNVLNNNDNSELFKKASYFIFKNYISLINDKQLCKIEEKQLLLLDEVIESLINLSKISEFYLIDKISNNHNKKNNNDINKKSWLYNIISGNYNNYNNNFVTRDSTNYINEMLNYDFIDDFLVKYN